MNDAASVTFYTLLALFPALAALVSICGLVADPKTIADNVSVLSGFLPGGGIDLINEQLKALTASPPKALGLGAIFGVLVSLWSANAGIKALFASLNDVYDLPEKRSFIRLTLSTLSVTVGGIFCLVVLIATTVIIPGFIAYFGIGEIADICFKLLRWPVLFLFLVVFLAVLYRFGPSREKVRWRWISWGSAISCILWLITSSAFSFYVEHFGSYNKTYGSLGAAIGFMTWMWISTIVILAGAEIDCQLEKQDEPKSTLNA